MNSITAFLEYPSKWNTTGTVTSMGKFAESAYIQFNVTNVRQKDSGNNHQHNEVTQFNQEKRTNCRSVRSQF